MNKVSVVIPTLQKNVEVLKKLLYQLEKDNSVSEIILIDNSKKGFELSISKLRVIVPAKSENLYVNQAWNLGVKEAKEEFYALINDDILICDNYCTKIVNLIENTPDLGVLGMDEFSVINTDIESYPEDTNFSLKLDNGLRRDSWGVAIWGKKSDYVNIPKNIKIWCGDDFIRYIAKEQGKNVYALTDAIIYHLDGLSSRNITLSDIKCNDLLEYAKIDKEFKQSEVYRSIADYNSLKNRTKRVIKKIFSISNGYDHHKKYKMMTILGLKVKIKELSK